MRSDMLFQKPTCCFVAIVSIVSQLSALRKVFHGRDEEIGHRIEYVLRNTIQTSFAIM